MTLARTVEEQRWLQGVESGAFGVWDLDPRLELVHYSPQWKARFGFPQVHAADSTGFWRSRVHPDDFDAMLRALRSHLDGFSSSYEMQFRLRTNGSGYRTVLSRGRVVMRDARGDATQMVGTMLDLTGRPVAPRPHGLAAESPGQFPIAGARLPLHVLLGATRLHAEMEGAACDTHTAMPPQEGSRLVETIADLLDVTLQQSSAQC